MKMELVVNPRLNNPFLQRALTITETRKVNSDVWHDERMKNKLGNTKNVRTPLLGMGLPIQIVSDSIAYV